MAFDDDEVRMRLKDFQVRNVRYDEGFEIGTKRLRGIDVMVPAEKKLLLACTDERAIKEVLNPKSGEEIDVNQFTVVRAAGAAFGLVDAVRNVKVTLQRQEILDALRENEVVVANHIDTQAVGEALTGCGQGALRELPESGSIFDRPAVALSERLSSFEEMGALRMVFDGDHVAQGLLVNPYDEKVLDPNFGEAENSFFSLDVGVYRKIVRWLGGALGFGEEAARLMLVKLTRNNLAAVFILSNAQINEAVYIERADEEDQFFAGVLHEGLKEFTEREGPIMRVMQKRMGDS